jgi:hypothetical protein
MHVARDKTRQFSFAPWFSLVPDIDKVWCSWKDHLQRSVHPLTFQGMFTEARMMLNKEEMCPRV